ncbi:YdiU family protein [Flavobacterium amniphilum]|uniref:protein adenylyltransferase SelO n=1 Tax=Flavobacterium amniphilum TaxID=1834035 RepID=UPI00202A6F41|nr:YdiU family protein [Flavobacterium amniphilum]MCL9807474.1 YdiU family protein [Flavobacterium amniphilum]
MQLQVRNIFTDTLPSDQEKTNEIRKVFNACYSFVNPTPPTNPSLIHVSKEVAQSIGINDDDITSEIFLNTFSGKTVYENSKPYAMCYGGHQFGVWAGQLGDGRAVNLFESNDQTLQLKGAGKTPYSRSADGLAVLRSSVREYLCAEAMHHLGVPTTRSLSLILSGNEVLRDIMYNGNPAYEKGAIVCRVAPSFIRFGNFELLASRNDLTNLKLLTDFTIKEYFPHINSEGKQKYLDFFQSVVSSTLKMVVEWQRVGFVHGVMNTDNMSIHGITIDYGPYGWLEDFNPNWTPNTTDNQHKRYRYGNQPEIALWNLYQLANALYPLINEAEGLEKILEQYPKDFEHHYQKMMQEKLGFSGMNEEQEQIVNQLVQILQLSETDYTIFFRLLSDVKKEDNVTGALEKINYAFYNSEEIQGEILSYWNQWMNDYLQQLQKEIRNDAERKVTMDKINPKYVLRNYMAQLAIDAADKGDYSIIDELYTLLQNPYNEQPEYQKWFAKRPDWARVKIGCSMLSCSS